MDEPTVSLDRDATALVAELVKAHVQDGGLAMIATHVDLGLGTLPELTLSPPAIRAPESSEDVFLQGAW